MTCRRVASLCHLILAAVAATGSLSAAELKPATLNAFQKYAAKVEGEIQGRLNNPAPLISLEATAANRAKLKQGEVLTKKFEGADSNVPSGLVHDWVGATFFPGTTADKVIAFLKDVPSHKNYYEEVIDSGIISQDGNRVRSTLRLRKKKVITVVLDSEYAAEYKQLSEKRWYMVSRSTRIVEIKDPGTPQEKAMPEGNDNGFLWRLNSYWRIDEADGGVYVELRTLSLTRGIPMGTGWIVKPFVTSIPKESLAATLDGTRKALASQ